MREDEGGEKGRERKGEDRGGKGMGQLPPKLGSLDPPVVIKYLIQ